MRIGALFCTVAAAAALVLFSPNAPEASALPGSFTYIAGDGKPRTSSRPPAGRCVPIVGSGPVKNMTTAKLTLYNSTTCDLEHKVAKVDPMSTVEDVPTFQAAFWDD